MKKLFNSNGRINRASYFVYTMILGSIGYGFKILLDNTDNTVLIFISLIAAIIALVVSFCITSQRLHDIELPGWQFFLLLIPIYNIYLNLLLLFKKGTDGPNKYGDDPLSIDVNIN